MTERYPTELLPDDEDDGTMPENVAALAGAVVGRRIVSVEQRPYEPDWAYGRSEVTVLTLDDGAQVEMYDTNDCCAYTALEQFLLHPESVDHMILGVGTTDAYTTWHVYADFGDVMKLSVGWSAGNPFYYGYGFEIRVVPPAPCTEGGTFHNFQGQETCPGCGWEGITLDR